MTRIECEKATFRIISPLGETWLLHVSPAPSGQATFELYATHGEARRLRITRVPSDMPAHELAYRIADGDQTHYDALMAQISPVVAMVRFE